MKENKNIVLKPNRKEIADSLKSEKLYMIAHQVETGLSLAGFDLTQQEYDEIIECALSND